MSALDRLIGQALRGIATLCLVALFLLLLANVVARGFQLAGFAWLDEVVQGLFAWMVFSGAAALWRENDHFRVDWLELRMGTQRSAAILGAILSLLSLAFFFAMTWYGWDLTDRSRAVTPILGFPTAAFYIAIPIFGAVMTGYTLHALFKCLQTLFTSTQPETPHDL
ncbi:TRAP transporter small permease [Pseudoruegeria sp. SK021]|uniref:TRAP transporter small permease n=1 Tax=Pseudoruegeria sp. SK021 TaxID=1933035 RepID=UPI000A2294CB|nr:TRAP transporter small permease [Pseudoruegeria sp. SK021]OSP54222.1 hypothetical protein BV911_13800 [Pseudoruegeria sp. SK021]